MTRFLYEFVPRASDVRLVHEREGAPVMGGNVPYERLERGDAGRRPDAPRSR
jgi:hypothetical protein